MGSAIYAAGIKSNETIVSKKMATIGGANTGGLYKRCKFNNCTRGIYLVKDYGAMITNNTLSQISYAGIDINNSINTQLIVNNNAITDFNQGLRFINCISNSVFAVQYNVLDQSGAALSPAAGSYQNTGMLFLNSTPAYSNAKVTNNVILECRNGIVGSGLVYANFTSNFIRYDRPQASAYSLIRDQSYSSPLLNILYYNTELTQEAIYAAFTDSMYSNDELLDMIQSLPFTLISEIQERRELFEIALMNQIAGYDSIEYNWSELEDLAYTNVREGSIAVYLARAILEKEVDDEEYGLRINHSVSTNQNCNFNIHKSEQFISTKFEGEYEIQIFDAAGKLIQKNSAVNNKQISIASIRSSSIYMLRCVASSCSTSYKFSK